MDLYTKVKKAVKENEVKELLQGKGEYSVMFDPFVGAVAPTDWTKIIPELYKVSDEEPNLHVNEMFENALVDLFYDDSENIYVALGAMYVQILREESNRAGFLIKRQRIIPICKAALKRETQNATVKIRPEIERYSTLLNKKWGIEVI